MLTWFDAFAYDANVQPSSKQFAPSRILVAVDCRLTQHQGWIDTSFAGLFRANADADNARTLYSFDQPMPLTLRFRPV
jgi:hypothetical protein